LAGRVVVGSVFAFGQLAAGLDKLGRGRRVIRVIDQAGKDDGPAGGQRSPGPPQVEGAWVAVPDRFLAGAGFVDRFQGEGDFDQFFAGHWDSLKRMQIFADIR
jgi:hypothetical protein